VLASAAGQTLSFRQISAGDLHTCGVTTDDRAYCWGANSDFGFGVDGGGQLGDGTTVSQRVKPTAVAGGLRFLEVSAGTSHSCGITTDYRAYCWGQNNVGQLGDGTGTQRYAPVLVAGGRRYRQVSAGYKHSCGVTTTNVAFCWGSNLHGMLGTGGASSMVPVRVARRLRFRRVIAAFSHTCGTTTEYVGYCWGLNSARQLGDGTRTNRSKPAAVIGGHSFRQVVPASGYISPVGEERLPDEVITCGVATDNLAYCWGVGSGQGDASLTVPVGGGQSFRTVSPGAFHTCGVNPSNVAFCWGENTSGQLGTGGGRSTTPVAVAGGLRFQGVSSSSIGQHTCGITTDHRAFCWGDNFAGQIGDGTRFINRTTPVPVAAPN
jgi:alpha-tubulin suppressor-like RCC1 family protein